MSIFGKIMGAIFGTKAEAAPAGGGAATGTGSLFWIGCAGAIRRCRSHPGQGGCRQG